MQDKWHRLMVMVVGFGVSLTLMGSLLWNLEFLPMLTRIAFSVLVAWACGAMFLHFTIGKHS